MPNNSKLRLISNPIFSSSGIVTRDSFKEIINYYYYFDYNCAYNFYESVFKGSIIIFT